MRYSFHIQLGVFGNFKYILIKIYIDDLHLACCSQFCQRFDKLVTLLSSCHRRSRGSPATECLLKPSEHGSTLVVQRFSTLTSFNMNTFQHHLTCCTNMYVDFFWTRLKVFSEIRSCKNIKLHCCGIVIAMITNSVLHCTLN